MGLLSVMLCNLSGKYIFLAIKSTSDLWEWLCGVKIIPVQVVRRGARVTNFSLTGGN